MLAFDLLWDTSGPLSSIQRERNAPLHRPVSTFRNLSLGDMLSVASPLTSPLPLPTHSWKLTVSWHIVILCSFLVFLKSSHTCWFFHVWTEKDLFFFCLEQVSFSLPVRFKTQPLMTTPSMPLRINACSTSLLSNATYLITRAVAFSFCEAV